MSNNIVINGKSVPKSDQAADASRTNYILIQAKDKPLNKAEKAQLKDLDVNINEFVGDEDNQLYLCGYKPESLEAIRRLDFIEYANVYQNDFVVPSTIETVTRQAVEPGESETIKVNILLHSDVKEASENLVKEIADRAGVNSSAISVENGLVRLDVSPENLENLAAVDEVRVIHPVNTRKLFNNVARRILGADNVTINNQTYKGEGQVVAVADTGFDKGSQTDVHDAFTGRVQKLFAWGRPNKTDDPDGHGTHVCGSVLGSGDCKVEGLIEGTAPAAKLIVQSTLSRFNGGTELGGIPDDLGKLFGQAYQANARVHTNSWGTPFPGTQRPYDTGAEGIDDFVWNNQDMTILFAAGNDGQDRQKDGTIDGKINERSLGAEAAAKNCITVGATENFRPNLTSGAGIAYTYGAFWPSDYPRNPIKDDPMANNPEGLSAFSSRGLTAENRLKPDIVAPGTAILSTRSRNKQRVDDTFGASPDARYLYEAGTSMATPLVAGCAAVVREALVKNGYKDEDVENGIKNPTGSLVKALLINGAIPIKGQYMPVEVGAEPNPHSGFGRVNLAGAVVVPGNQATGYGTGVIDEDQKPVEIEVPVPKGKRSSAFAQQQQQPNGDPAPGAAGAGLAFTVTLAYADPAGAKLQNDLNLVVVAGDRERHGNQGEQEFAVDADAPFDRRNNVEQVRWRDVPGEEVRIVVKAWRVTSERVPFAYAWKFE